MSGDKLRDTLALLRREGWSENGPYGDERQRCLYVAAAVARVAGADYVALRGVIREQYPERQGDCNCHTSACGIAPFNDHPATTFEDVERVLEKAALRRDEAAQ